MIWALILIASYVAFLILVGLISLRPPKLVPLFMSPGALGAPQQTVTFTAADGVRLQGWWMPSDKSDVVAILCHGYLMNRSEMAATAFSLWQRGIACMLFDFRHHGASRRATCGFGWTERLDVHAAVAWVQTERPGSRIVLIGSSMGAAASAFALAESPKLAEALILDGCYDRFVDATLGWWRFLGGPALAFVLSPTVIVAAPFGTANPFTLKVSEHLTNLQQTPVLLLHGDRDNLALPSAAKRNAAACGGQIIWFEGCGHAEGRWEKPQQYNDAILAFLDSNGLLP